MPKSEDEISALMDNETGRFELLRVSNEICSNEIELQRWGRYHLIRDALQGNLPDLIDKQFADNIRQLVQTEAASLGHSTKQHSRFFKPGIGIALAASVAVVTVLAYRSFISTPDSLIVPTVAKVAGEADSTVDPVLASGNMRRARLNSYLVNHAEHTGQHGMSNHARVIGYSVKQD